MITIEELESQIKEAKKGKAKVDNEYVGNADGLDHIFEYNYDYARFLTNVTNAIKAGKARKQSGEGYTSEHEIIIQ